MSQQTRVIELNVVEETVALDFGGEGIAMFSVDDLYTWALERNAFLPENGLARYLVGLPDTLASAS